MSRAVARCDPRDMTIAGFSLTATGLAASGKPSFDDWQTCGAYLERCGGAVQWWIGDWLNYGEGRPQWGDKYYQAATLLGFEPSTLMSIKSIAKSVDPLLRNKNLTWNHHVAVAPLDAAQQAEILAWAATPNENGKIRTVLEVRSEVRRRRLARGLKEKPLPMDKFGVIYADPPWQYEFSLTDSRQVENQYPTMTLDEICDLPISPLCPESCVLFLWATSPKLADAMSVIELWGFSYRTCMVWAKDKIGMGYYARQKHELLLIAAMGDPPIPQPGDRPPSVIEAPREEHSRKPVQFYEIIEKMYPNAAKVELFCRQPRQGWSVWGNEV